MLPYTWRFKHDVENGLEQAADTYADNAVDCYAEGRVEYVADRVRQDAADDEAARPSAAPCRGHMACPWSALHHSRTGCEE